jgi:hypothetical protein
MDISPKISVAVCLALLSGCGVNSQQQQQQPHSQTFVAFDATMYSGKPDLSQSGLKPLPGLYQANLWNSSADNSNPPNPANVAPLLQQAGSGSIFLDIENWSLDGTEATASIQKYLSTIQSFQQYSPSLSFGYYGVSPVRDYWDAISDPGSAEYKSWQARNNAVAPIAQRANVLFPSIYTFYPDQAGWKKYAIAQISEARRIGPGKPVYAFLWPQYNDYGAYLPPDYWRMELETARQYADGVVIWGGYQQTWDDNAPWWQETQDFMNEISKSQ